MTTQEVIKSLRMIKSTCYIGNRKFLDALEQAVEMLEAQKWIPCSERLPDSKEYVLVTDYGETNIGRRFCGKWWLDYCGDKMKDVTAWMPLPEPYKAESEEV